MALALYRRYRPETFADVIGQEHVTEPLMQALRTGRVNHAYLFSGPRGCGKTTSARILARCLNCEQGPTPTPCGTCDSCLGLARGGPGTVDVIEIDAASHGGVDDARELRERAAYGPAVSRYKVYVIDEAHMVSPQGFNALLKVVEEPPEHVKFVFATTEPDKVIGTIRSRTHHYPFRLVPPLRLQDYLAQLCQREGVAVAPGVLSFVVRAGGGSVRDSLSVLDQLVAGSGEAGLTYEGAAALLGFTQVELLDAVTEGLAAGDPAAVFRQVDKVIESGHDPRRFVEDLLERMRDLIVVAAVPDGGATVLRGIPADQLERMRTQAAAFGQGALSRAADIVNAGLTEMTGATAPRLQLELICARVLLPGASGESGYAARLDRLERRLDMAPHVPAAASATHSAAPPRSASLGTARVDGTGAAQTDVAERRRAESESRRPVLSGPAAGGGGPGSRGPGSGRRTGSEGAADAEQPTEGETAPGASSESSRSGATSARGSGQAPRPATTALPPDPPPGRSSDPTSVPAAFARGAGAVDADAIRRSWPDVLARIASMRRVTWTFLSEHARVLDYDGDRLLLGIATMGLATTFRSGPHAEVVRQALIEVLGVEARVEGQVDAAVAPGADTPAGSAPAGPAPAGLAPAGPAPASAPPPGSAAPAMPDPAAWPDEPPPSDEEPPELAGPAARRMSPRRAGAAAARTDDGVGIAVDAGAVGSRSRRSPGPSGLSGRAVPVVASRPATGSGPPPGSASRARSGPTSRADASGGVGAVGSSPGGIGDDEVSADDEDLAVADDVGEDVVRRLLGGTVLSYDDG